MTRNALVRVVSKALVPFIALFALYTQFHGDYGAGGGFQAGVILAAAFVLFGLIMGVERLDEVFSPRAREIAVAGGVLLYAGVGVVTMALGGNYLDYGALDSHDPKHGQHLGLLLIELGVGVTVASAMVILFGAFASRSRVPEVAP